MKLKKCNICKIQFTPVRFAQICCSVDCAIKHSIALKRTESAIERKKKREQYRNDKLKLKSLAEWLNEAQAIFNKWIRLRDDKEPCISCGRFHAGQYHAGHYRTRGSAGHLRFNEDNCHKQCSVCKNHLSGNIVNYRPKLIDKIGLERVIKLESDNSIHRFTIEEAKDIKTTYRNKIKELLKV